VAVSVTGLDVLFSGNEVHCWTLAGGQGWGCVLTDFDAPGDSAPHVGKFRNKSKYSMSKSSKRTGIGAGRADFHRW
jgi:hypothetical protein